MKTKTRKNNGYIYPASELLKQFPDDMWASTIGEFFNVHMRTVQLWRRGEIKLDQWNADKYACLLGKHPSEIWSNWFDDVDLAS